ncbi:hypothetical protein [Flavobacterium aquicola]|uniref:Uncharacterized protein n=1 Tax=Flavobacterium aquicola TaxID=1682742 RepID=A0A3E0DWV6_9FLAO|nr:hypothetical protein [Flavobacterium aquicola]REG90435.1 hypothetical protein C8P67_1252 [Flavobacterium aquicola]
MKDIDKQKLFYKSSFPKGEEYFSWLFSKDDMKENMTMEIYEKDEKFKSLETLKILPDILETIYNVSTCYYGCTGGAHIIEYITGRGYNLGISAFKILRLGFYDEALSLIRSISEINNLFSLFGIDEKAKQNWYDMNEKERIREFSPAKVREKMSKTVLEAPISREYYSKLCEVGVHVNPTTKPQGKNHVEKAMIGGFVTKELSIAVLNDLAFNLVWLAILALRNSVSQETFLIEVSKIQPHFSKIGDLNIETIDQYMNEQKNGK